MSPVLGIVTIVTIALAAGLLQGGQQRKIGVVTASLRTMTFDSSRRNTEARGEVRRTAFVVYDRGSHPGGAGGAISEWPERDFNRAIADGIAEPLGEGLAANLLDESRRRRFRYHQDAAAKLPR